MFLTNVLLKPKAKNVMVMVQSMVSGHRLIKIRERLGEKLEFMAFDPFVQKWVLYRETKRVHSMKY